MDVLLSWNHPLFWPAWGAHLGLAVLMYTLYPLISAYLRLIYDIVRVLGWALLEVVFLRVISPNESYRRAFEAHVYAYQRMKFLDAPWPYHEPVKGELISGVPNEMVTTEVFTWLSIHDRLSLAGVNKDWTRAVYHSIESIDLQFDYNHPIAPHVLRAVILSHTLKRATIRLKNSLPDEYIGLLGRGLANSDATYALKIALDDVPLIAFLKNAPSVIALHGKYTGTKTCLRVLHPDTKALDIRCHDYYESITCRDVAMCHLLAIRIGPTAVPSNLDYRSQRFPLREMWIYHQRDFRGWFSALTVALPDLRVLCLVECLEEWDWDVSHTPKLQHIYCIGSRGSAPHEMRISDAVACSIQVHYVDKTPAHLKHFVRRWALHI